MKVQVYCPWLILLEFGKHLTSYGVQQSEHFSHSVTPSTSLWRPYSTSHWFSINIGEKATTLQMMHFQLNTLASATCCQSGIIDMTKKKSECNGQMPMAVDYP